MRFIFAGLIILSQVIPAFAMRLYYLANHVEETPARRRIVVAAYDKDVFEVNLSTAGGVYAIYEIDEIAPDNQTLCIDLFNSIGKTNDVGLGKYFIEGGVLFRRDGWTPRRIP